MCHHVVRPVYSQLVKCGFKEIEIAYPAASDTDFSFVRMIVDKKMGVDEGVWIQVGGSHLILYSSVRLA